jgi:hypothetical protein
MPHGQKYHREAVSFFCNMMRQHFVVVRVSPRVSAVNFKINPVNPV